MARHMRNGRDYSRPGPKVDYELRKGSNNAARSGEVYNKIEEIQSQISDDIDRVTQDGVVLTSPYTCTRKRECIRVEVAVAWVEKSLSGGQIFVNGHLAVKHTSTHANGTFSVQTLIYLYEGDVLTFSKIGNGQANAWRVSDD